MRKLHLAVAVIMFCLFIGAPLLSANADAASALSGTVVETIDSGSYTYVAIEKDGNKTWVAAPKTNVKVGQQITFAPGMPMVNFTSKSLNRTFEVIYFTGGVIN